MGQIYTSLLRQLKCSLLKINAKINDILYETVIYKRYLWDILAKIYK